MTLANLRKILTDAREGKYAVGSFNAIDIQSARAVIKAAEKENSPVIIAIAEDHLNIAPLELILPVCMNLAENSSVPVVVILDHGKTYSTNVQAIKMGISAVMFDGSTKSFEENIKQTKEIVKVAHTLGVSVEAELGHVASSEIANSEKTEEIEDSIYTNPQDVIEFIDRTGVDALAISFGTIHGICRKPPKLNISLVQEINNLSKVPLVMHGTSGTTEEDIIRAIKAGISKINYYSENAYLTARHIQENLEAVPKPYYHDILMWGFEKMVLNIQSKIQLFGSSGKA